MQAPALPGETATAGDVWSFADALAGRLDDANRYKRAGLEVIEGCERRDAAAAAHVTRRFWEVWK